MHSPRMDWAGLDVSSVELDASVEAIEERRVGKGECVLPNGKRGDTLPPFRPRGSQRV